MKDILYSIMLRFSRWMRAEKEMVRSLDSVDEVKEGEMYEHYGRYVIAEKTPYDVDVYNIKLTPESTAEAYKNVLSMCPDECQYSDGGYDTTDRDFADKMKRQGCHVELRRAEPCHKCCFEQLGLPCTTCDMQHIFRLHSTKKQYATDQKAWAKAMEKRIRGGR